MTMAKALMIDRIRDALNSGTSAEVSALIQEVEAAATQSQAASAAARERALDPLISTAELAQARKDSEDALFEADRMDRAAVALRDAMKRYADAEEDGRRRDAYEETKSRLKDMGDLIRSRYPALVNELGSLLRDMVEMDRVVERANARLPKGADRLRCVDFAARGFIPNAGNTHSGLAQAVRLPRLSGGDSVWGPGRDAFAGLRFIPEATNATPVTPSGDAETGEAGSSAPASPVVRLVAQKIGEAA